MTTNCDSQTPNLDEGEGEYTASELLPGFVFAPTDQEIITSILTKKAIGEDLPSLKLVDEVNLYAYHPGELVEKFKSREREGRWYFFTWTRRRYENGKRPARSAANGFWKTIVQNAGIKNGEGTEIGCKKTLTFIEGKQRDKANQKTTGWLMQEYRLPDEKPEQTQKSDELVLCKIYRSDRWKGNENDATNASNVNCTKDETSTPVGNRPNCTTAATNATVGDCPMNKRQKKSSNPTPAPSSLTQQQPQPYAPQIPTQNTVQLQLEQIPAPNWVTFSRQNCPVPIVPLQTRNPCPYRQLVPPQHFSQSVVYPSQLQLPPVSDFHGARHGYYSDLLQVHDAPIPDQNFHPQQQQNYMSTFARYGAQPIQQASTSNDMRQAQFLPRCTTRIQQLSTNNNMKQAQPRAHYETAPTQQASTRENVRQVEFHPQYATAPMQQDLTTDRMRLAQLPPQYETKSIRQGLTQEGRDELFSAMEPHQFNQ